MSNPFKSPRLRQWLHAHSLKLLAIRDTPNAIAGGVAIGIFIGFTPLIGLKTLLSIFIAWLTGCNLLAAVIAVQLHDVLFLLMPVIYFWEYEVGYWLLSHPHHLPPELKHLRNSNAWRSWTTLSIIYKPLLVGSIVCAAPVALASFFTAKALVVRHHKKAKSPPPPESPEATKQT